MTTPNFGTSKLGTVTVLPSLPEGIARLSELAYNLYWTWEPEARTLYRHLNPQAWYAHSHNPVRVLLETSRERMEEVAADPNFVARYQRVMAAFDSYMNKKETWAAQNAPHLKPIAYFSMEYGLSEALPIYSGGLGVLAGDHCKSASDLGLPFTAVGLLFREGYFTQQLNAEGWQEERYANLDPTTLPLRPVQDEAGEQRIISVTIEGREVRARIWQVQVGRIRILLLDSDVAGNHEDDRRLTARLYGGDHHQRIRQYVLLGVGGVRALRAAGVEAEVWHMNEGHAAFLNLERIRERVKERGMTFDTAHELTAAGTLFTTHTPVPAGNDVFSGDLARAALNGWPEALGISFDQLAGLARGGEGEGSEGFNMTAFALRMSRMANGVSELHGKVSREMWAHLYPGLYPGEVPIGYVTNGAHNLTFTSQKMRELLDTVLEDGWTERLEQTKTWQPVHNLSAEALASVQRGMKEDMIKFVRAHQREMLLRNGGSAAQLEQAEHLLSPDALTIGFARRFATYKRATLLLRDPERLARIVGDPERPVQFVFAGKAHPADQPGKALIQEIYRASQRPEFAGRIVMLENYDMYVARRLVQGVDVWLNNPRRPMEASGTSGMKASFNGSPNFSVLDGWWVEGFDGDNGWRIGEEREYASETVQDDADAHSFYRTLEQELVPLYYGGKTERGNTWADVVRDSIISVSGAFSMQRQVVDYTQQYYLPLSERGGLIRAEGGVRAREIAEWKSWIRAQWSHVGVTAQSHLPATAQPGETVEIVAEVDPARIQAGELRAEVVLGGTGTVQRIAMQADKDGGDGQRQRFHASFTLECSGIFDIGVRVYPYIAGLAHEFEMGLVKWASAQQ